MRRAAELLDAMRNLGLKPDVITFSTLIKGYLSLNDFDQAFAVFKQMLEIQKDVDAFIYNTMLDAGVRKHRLEFSETIYQMMQDNNVRPSSFTVTILVKLFGRRHDLEAAFDIVDKLPKQHNFPLNSHVYTCLISACIQNNAFPRALQVFATMKACEDEQSAPDAKTYSALLTGACRGGHLEDGVKLFHETIAAGKATAMEHAPFHQLKGLASRMRRKDIHDEITKVLADAGVQLQEQPTQSSHYYGNNHHQNQGHHKNYDNNNRGAGNQSGRWRKMKKWNILDDFRH